MYTKWLDGVVFQFRQLAPLQPETTLPSAARDPRAASAARDHAPSQCSQRPRSPVQPETPGQPVQPETTLPASAARDHAPSQCSQRPQGSQRPRSPVQPDSRPETTASTWWLAATVSLYCSLGVTFPLQLFDIDMFWPH